MTYLRMRLTGPVIRLVSTIGAGTRLGTIADMVGMEAGMILGTMEAGRCTTRGIGIMLTGIALIAGAGDILMAIIATITMVGEAIHITAPITDLEHLVVTVQQVMLVVSTFAEALV